MKSVGLDLDLELANFGVKLCSSMVADCVVIALSPVVCAGLWVKKKQSAEGGAKRARGKRDRMVGGGLRCSKLWRGGCDVLAMSMVGVAAS